MPLSPGSCYRTLCRHGDAAPEMQMPTLCLHIWIFDWILVGPRIAVDVADRLGCLEELEALEPDDALALDEENIRHWLSGHDRVALPPGGLERFRAIPGPF